MKEQIKGNVTVRRELWRTDLINALYFSWNVDMNIADYSSCVVWHWVAGRHVHIDSDMICSV